MSKGQPELKRALEVLLADDIVRDEKTGEVRKDHTHLRCAMGAELSDSGDYFSHDHYCDMVDEGCDDAYCFGTLGNGERDIRDKIEDE